MGRTKASPVRYDSKGMQSTVLLTSPEKLRQKSHQLQAAIAEAEAKDLEDALDDSSDDDEKRVSAKGASPAAQKRRKLEALSKRNAERSQSRSHGTSLDSLFASAFNTSMSATTASPVTNERGSASTKIRTIPKTNKKLTFQDSDDDDRKQPAVKSPLNGSPAKARRIMDDDDSD